MKSAEELRMMILKKRVAFAKKYPEEFEQQYQHRRQNGKKNSNNKR